MRTRNIKIAVYLNQSEYEHINTLVEQSKLSRESYIWMLINGRYRVLHQALNLWSHSVCLETLPIT